MLNKVFGSILGGGFVSAAEGIANIMTSSSRPTTKNASRR